LLIEDRFHFTQPQNCNSGQEEGFIPALTSPSIFLPKHSQLDNGHGGGQTPLPTTGAGSLRPNERYTLSAPGRGTTRLKAVLQTQSAEPWSEGRWAANIRPR